MNRDSVILIGLWVLWLWPFLVHQVSAPRRSAEVTVKSSRWGIGLQVAAFFLAWNGGRQPGPIAEAAAAVLGCVAVVVSWTAVRALGKQLRIHAGLYADHELVRGGPYRLVRHPIYAGMLAIFVATALLRSSWVWSAIGLAIFIVGTEIRVRIEDGLLASRFGKRFEEYKASTPAYLPLVR